MSTHPNRKNFFNERYFESIDTEDKAYWLGFITADGNVSSGERNSLCVGLKESDIGHLCKMASSLEYSGKISRNAKTKSVRISLYSKLLVTDLSEYGVVPNKSLIVKPWVCKNALLESSYWRGVFDGDGCITFCTRTRGNRVYTEWSVSLAGNSNMINGFRYFVTRNANLSGCIENRKNIQILKFAGIYPCKVVMSILYDNSSIFLERKKNLADAISCLEKKRKELDFYKSDELIEKYKHLGNWTLVADSLKIQKSSLFSLLRRRGVEVGRKSQSV